jgi:two-component system heavy metal sensor histidine kinase CusS
MTISIRQRLTIWYSIVLSFGLIVFSFVLWSMLWYQLRSDLDDSLRNQARGLEEYLRIEEGDATANLTLEVDEYSRSMPFDHLLAVFDARGNIIYANTPVKGILPRGWMSANSADSSTEVKWMGRRYLAITRTAKLQSGRVYLFIAESTAPVDHALRRLSTLLLAVLPIFICGGAAGGFWLSRRALSPVDDIVTKARSIGADNLSERLVSKNTNDEVQRLTDTFNEMLGRLEASFARISQFTADASHELRTPISVIRLAAEKAIRKSRPEVEYREALQSIQAEAEGMSHLIENLLYLARLGSGSAADQFAPVNLSEAVRAACDEVKALATNKRILLTQHFEDSSVFVFGSFTSLERLALILLDNAIKYTPEQGAVSVSVQSLNGDAILRVADSGGGVPEDMKSRIFERFFRGDKSRNRDDGGYGLGLAIAKAIAEQHSGSIEIGASDLGGSLFSVILRRLDETELHPLSLETKIPV